MKNIYLCANAYTEEQIRIAAEARDRLLQSSHVICEDPSEAELILSLGGDGALLRAAQIAVKADKPLLGVNYGRLGFLCAMKAEELDHFEELLQDCVCCERTMLELEEDGKTHLALNDIIISKSNFGSTVDLSLLIDDRADMDIRGDGLIIATPTGSTAYNLAAGGSRLDPEAEVLALTPICPHTKDIYPKVIRDDRQIIVQVNHDDAQVYVDGRHVADFHERILVRKARQSLHLYVRKQS